MGCTRIVKWLVGILTNLIHTGKSRWAMKIHKVSIYTFHNGFGIPAFGCPIAGSECILTKCAETALRTGDGCPTMPDAVESVFTVFAPACTGWAFVILIFRNALTILAAIFANNIDPISILAVMKRYLIETIAFSGGTYGRRFGDTLTILADIITFFCMKFRIQTILPCPRINAFRESFFTGRQWRNACPVDT